MSHKSKAQRRPLSTDKRNCAIHIKTTVEERDRIKAQAEARGISVARYLLSRPELEVEGAAEQT